MCLHDDVEEVTPMVIQVVMWDLLHLQRVEWNVEKGKFDQKA